MQNEMTDKDIVKALKYCQDTEGDSCQCCEYLDVSGCQIELLKDALNLINQQQAEIEKLNVELVGMRGACNSYKMHYDNAKAEIERLKEELEIRNQKRASIFEISNAYERGRAKAIKELEAKIHEKLHEAEMHGNFEPVVTREMFDSVVKELVGEGK